MPTPPKHNPTNSHPNFLWGFGSKGLVSEVYEYSFQAQEHDDEIKGPGNSINYKYRMHDTRLGRFFAVDPLAAKYPWNSPYAFSENRVIDGVELEGLEWYKTINLTDLTFQYRVKIKVVNESNVKQDYVALVMLKASEYFNTSIKSANEKGSGEIIPIYTSTYDPDKDFSLVIKNKVIKNEGEVAGTVKEEGNTEVNVIEVELTGDIDEDVNTIVHELGHTGGLFDNEGEMDKNSMTYDEKGRLITSKVMPLSIIGKKMKQMREVSKLLNLMYNYGSDPQLIQEQLDLIDKNIPNKNKNVETSVLKTKNDNTDVSLPLK